MTAVRSHHRICVILGEGPVCFEIIASYSMALIISDIFFCAEINDGQMVLGIPGAYDQQERFMANMFGFPYFKESRHYSDSGKERLDIGIV